MRKKKKQTVKKQTARDPAAAELGDDPAAAPAVAGAAYTETELRRHVEDATAETQDKYLRVLAEYENFRKRTQRERAKWTHEGFQGFLADLLPVFDSLDKARDIGGDDVGAVRDGLDAIERQLKTVLSKYEIERVDPEGELFDPRRHEALQQQPTSDHAPGTVLVVLERGYTVGDFLVRPARVVVAAEPPKE